MIIQNPVNSRPLAVTVIAWAYIAVGTIGFLYHFRELMPPVAQGALWIEPIRLLAIVAGVYLLRGDNWARWVTLGWMALHVGIGMLNSTAQMAMHALFLAVIAYFLFFRPEAARYFRPI